MSKKPKWGFSNLFKFKLQGKQDGFMHKHTLFDDAIEWSCRTPLKEAFQRELEGIILVNMKSAVVWLIGLK